MTPVSFRWADVWLLISAVATTASAIATIVLAVGARKGLQSIKLARADMLTRARREALKAALERCEEWAQVVLLMNGNILAKLSAETIDVFVKEPSEVRFEPDNEPDLAKARAWVTKLPPDIYRDSLAVLKRIEAWSAYFTTGMADEKAAYLLCATSFCSMVVQNYGIGSELLACGAQR